MSKNRIGRISSDATKLERPRLTAAGAAAPSVANAAVGGKPARTPLGKLVGALGAGPDRTAGIPDTSATTRTSSALPPLATTLTFASPCAPTAVIRLESTSIRKVAFCGPLTCGLGIFTHWLSLVRVAYTHFLTGVDSVSS